MFEDAKNVAIEDLSRAVKRVVEPTFERARDVQRCAKAWRSTCSATPAERAYRREAG